MKKIKYTIACTLVLSVIFQHSMIGQSQLKAVHEWGTFTTVQNSAGLRLSGLGGEKLPAFVYDLGLNSKNNIELKNVEVQMETPVLYFYADKQMNATIDVKFKNGIINQWYPDRSSGQSIVPFSVVDLAVPSEGFNKWEITILDPTATPKLIDDWTIVNHEYVAPRWTSSNHIKGQTEEYEKFIFYRGLANFETPLRVEFNQKNNLVIHNQFNSPLSYVLVYDNSPDRQPTIWWSGSMKADEKKVIANPIKDSEFNDVFNEIYHFRDEMVKSGLNQDEADAMLNTWFEGYFVDITDVEGLRVFWITPKSYIDEILPLIIAPTPLSTKRVFVGRSEVLKKEFEKELAGLTEDEIENKYKDHRYRNVFKDSKKKGLPTQWTDYNENVVSSVNNKNKSPLTLKLMPNPIADAFIIQYRSDEIAELQVSIVDLSGHVLRQWKENPNELIFKKSYSLKDLQSGAYILQTSQKGRVNSLKFIKN